MPTRTCKVCGKTQTLKARVRSDTCKSCSNKIIKKRLGTGKGWYVGPQGYVVGCVQGKHSYYHRYIMEQHLGRKLKPKEEVHHVNNNTLDNRIENLKLCTNHKEHTHNHPTILAMLKSNAKKAADIRWGNN
jgi:hypothetical protein